MSSTDSSTSEEPVTNLPSITSSGSSSDMTTLHYPPAGVNAEQKAAEREELTLKSVQHIAQLNVVQQASSMYSRLKEWNCLCKMYLNTAEWALRKAVLPVAPLQRFLHTPIHKVDDITLKGLEYVEEKFPAVTLTSQQMLENINKNVEAVKKYSARKVRDVIEGTLRYLPESLVPDNVHIDGHVSCTQSAIKHAQKIAAAPVGIDIDSSQASDVRETYPVSEPAQASDSVKSVQALNPVSKSVQASDSFPNLVQPSTNNKNEKRGRARKRSSQEAKREREKRERIEKSSTDSSTSEEPVTNLPSINSSGSSSDMTTLHYPPAGVNAEQKAAEREELTLKSVQHIAQLPVVQQASSMYSRLKEWNCLCKLYLNTAEWALRKAVLPVAPLQRFLHTPIHKVDDITLKGLEYVEEKFPAVTLTSQQMLENINKNIEAVKKYSARKVRDVIEGTLRSLPESLVPDSVLIDGHVSCTQQSAIKHAQKIAAAPVGIDIDSSQASDVRETYPVSEPAQASDSVKSVQALNPVSKSVQASDSVSNLVQPSTNNKNEKVNGTQLKRK